MKIKNNIEGKITNENKNYDISDAKDLPSLFEEGDSSVYGIKQNRSRLKSFPDRLPTDKQMPYPMDEHSKIGEFENKQNIYLTLAHAYNKVMQRVEDLEKEIEQLKKQ